MDTPIFDGVLGDRLAQAREAVALAERDGLALAAALTRGQAAALEELAQTRAEALTRERTAELTARVAGLESELRRLRSTDGGDPAAAEPAEQAAPAGPPPAPAVVPPTPAARVVVAPAAGAVTVAAARPAGVRDGTVRAGRPAPVRTGRTAADAGPTGEDVPSVPSMKDLFASTRAAGWLDQLLGAKR